MQDIKTEYKGCWKSILINAGLEEKYFSGKHQACPFCKEGKDRYRYVLDKELLYCNVCGVRGGINSYMEWTGLSFKQSCEKIRNTKVNYQKSEARRKPDPMILLKRIHSKLAKVQAGDVVDTYLNSRKITIRPPDVLTGSKMPYYGGRGLDGQKVAGVYDCMVSRITNVGGGLQSYHLVYLTPEGRKIENAQAKIIVTPITTITGCSVKIPLVYEIDITVMGIAEGIETGLAIAQDEGLTVWAGISANGMSSIIIPDTIKTVFIYSDNDSNYVGQAAAYKLAARLKASGKEVKVFVPEIENTDWADTL